MAKLVRSIITVNLDQQLRAWTTLVYMYVLCVASPRFTPEFVVIRETRIKDSHRIEDVCSVAVCRL